MTRSFDDQVAWLVAHAPASAVAVFARVSWRTVTRIVTRVVAEATEHLDRLDGLRRIGVDEFSYRKGHRYLTVIVDHDTGRLVWAAEGARKQSLQAFFDELGPARTAKLTHISADAGAWIAAVLAERATHVIWCMDPFHVIQWATKALDRCRARVLNRIAGLSRIDRRNLRWALLKNPENLSGAQRQARDAVVLDANTELALAYQLKESLRYVFGGGHKHPDRALDRWITQAAASRIPEMVSLAKSVQQQHIQIYNAIVCGQSNARTEATNTHLRALTKRAYGFHSAEALIAMATLTRGGICPELPHK